MNRNNPILPQEFEEIEQYLFKEMPEEQLLSFTKRLESEEDLRDKVHTVRLIKIGIQEDQLARDLQRFNDGMKASTSKNTSSGRNIIPLKFLFVAASVLIIAAIGVFLFFFNPGKEERLYSNYYKPDSGLISSMSSSDDYIFDRAMIDYKTGEYKKAIQSWDSLLKERAGNDTLEFFIASSYLAMDNYEEAITHFKKVVTQENSVFLEDANWYLGLAYLKTNKKEMAILSIEKSDHPQKEELLEKLRK